MSVENLTALEKITFEENEDNSISITLSFDENQTEEEKQEIKNFIFDLLLNND